MTSFVISNAAGDVERITSFASEPLRPGETMTALAGVAAIPVKTTQAATLRVANGALAWADSRTLAQAKADRLAVMRDAREAAIAAGFSWSGSIFDADEKAQTRLLGVLMASQAVGFVPVSWRLADNSWRTLSASDAAGVLTAMAAHIRSHFSIFATKETAINAAISIAAVDAIVWA